MFTSVDSLYNIWVSLYPLLWRFICLPSNILPVHTLNQILLNAVSTFTPSWFVSFTSLFLILSHQQDHGKVFTKRTETCSLSSIEDNETWGNIWAHVFYTADVKILTTRHFGSIFRILSFENLFVLPQTLLKDHSSQSEEIWIASWLTICFSIL